MEPNAESRTRKSLDLADLLARLIVTILASLLSDPLKKGIRRIGKMPHKRFLLGSTVVVAGYILILLGGDVEYIYLPGMIGFLLFFAGIFVVGQTSEALSFGRKVANSRATKTYEYAFKKIDREYLSKSISVLTLPVLIKWAWDGMLAFGLRSAISYDPASHTVYLILMGMFMFSSLLWLRSTYLFLSRELRNLKRHFAHPSSN